jgi:hypothetical protein
MTYAEFVQEWDGKQVTKFGGQCVALVAEFEAENNRPIIWGDAATWANNPSMLSAYDWIANNPNDSNQLPNQGDIVIWGGNLPYTNGAGHIAFYDHNLTGHQFMSFGQNSGGPSAHFQSHSWDYVVGWYHFRQTPPALVIINPITSYESISPVIAMVTNKQPTVWWGLNNTTTDFNSFYPAAKLDFGTQFEVAGYAHHINGQTYAMSPTDFNRAIQGDFSTNNGVNVNDLSTIPVVAPVYTPPQAPVTVPLATKPYSVIVTIKAYPSDTDAKNDTNASTTVAPGEYLIYKTADSGMLYIGKTQGEVKYWINPAENHEPVIEVVKPNVPAIVLGGWDTPKPKPVVAPSPAPAPVAKPSIFTTSKQELADSYQPFHDKNGEVFVCYRFLVDYVLQDLTGGPKIYKFKAGDKLDMAGTVISHNGGDFLRPANNLKNDTYFCVSSDRHIVELADNYRVIRDAADYIFTEVKKIDPNRPLSFAELLEHNKVKLARIWDVYVVHKKK